MRRRLQSLALSPDGTKIATAHEDGNSYSICLWDVQSGKETRRFELKSAFSPTAIVISPDGKFLAGVGSGVYIWDLHSGKVRWRITLGDGNVGNLAIRWASSAVFSPNGKMLAVGASRHVGIGLRKGNLETIYFLETATGRERARFDGGESVSSVAFSPSGRVLASVSRDLTILLWDVLGRAASATHQKEPLSGEKMNQCWHILAGDTAFNAGWVDFRMNDAAKAWQAIRLLGARPEQTVALFKKRLRPATSMQSQRLKQLVADLDSLNFNLREKAMNELVDLGPTVEPSLRKLYASNPSDRVKRCLEDLLEPVGQGRIALAELRHTRALETLEYIGTEEAKHLLRIMAKGAAASARTQDAQAILDRLAKRGVPARMK